MWTPKHLSTIQQEERRLEAVRLLQTGELSQSEIAQSLGVSRQVVNRWTRQLRAYGPHGLLRRVRQGRQPYLSMAQWQEVLTILRLGAQAANFATDCWTLKRIAQVIERQFGVRYNAHYVGDRLHALGWSVQVPEIAPRERNEELVQAWLRGDWPRILKKHVVWEHKSPSLTRLGSRF